MLAVYNMGRTRLRSGFISGVAALVVALCASVVFAAAARADEAADAGAIVEKLHAGLEHLMAEGEMMGQEGAIAYIGGVVDETYNLSALTAQSVGPSAFRAFEDSDKALVVAAYRDFAIANYVSRFAKRLPISFEAKNVEAGPRGAFVVHTLLNRKSGDPVQLSYVIVTDGAGAQGIADVLYDGVSEAARRRSELSSLARQGAAPLAAALSKKASQILAGDV